jgi:hypothetical protein
LSESEGAASGTEIRSNNPVMFSALGKLGQKGCPDSSIARFMEDTAGAACFGNDVPANSQDEIPLARKLIL